MTRVAREIAPVAGQEHPDVHLVGLGLQPLKPAPHPVILAVAVQNQPLLLGAQVSPRDAGRNAALFAERKQLAPLPLGGFDPPRFDSAVLERQTRVGDDQLQIKINRAAKALALLARTQRAVEREQVGDRLLVHDLTRRALQPVGKGLLGLLGVGKDEAQPALAVLKGLLQGVVGAFFVARADAQAINHHAALFLTDQALGPGVQLLDVNNRAGHQQTEEAGPDQTVLDVAPGQAVRDGDTESDIETRALGLLLGQLSEHRLGRVALDRLAALATRQHPDLGKQELEVVVQLDGRRPKSSRHSGVGPRRTRCRRPDSTCPSRSPR